MVDLVYMDTCRQLQVLHKGQYSYLLDTKKRAAAYFCGSKLEEARRMS